MSVEYPHISYATEMSQTMLGIESDASGFEEDGVCSTICGKAILVSGKPLAPNIWKMAVFGNFIFRHRGPRGPRARARAYRMNAAPSVVGICKLLTVSKWPG
jgi:hypothetical protein